MSIYCHLSCKRCRESLFVKDADSDVHSNPNELGQFLEKHYRHELIYTWEDDQSTYEGSVPDPTPDNEPSGWQRFKVPTNGWWSSGKFFEENIEPSQPEHSPNQ